MRRKELFLRVGAVALSAFLVLSNPIAVLADSGTNQTASVVVEEVKDSAGVDIPPEEDEVLDDDVADPTEKQPDNSTDVDNPREDAGNSSVSTPSDAEEVEEEEPDNDIEVKQFTIKVIDHFGDTAKERESITLDKGSEYSYSALSDDESWIVVGNSAYDGVLTKDLTINFFYDSVEKSTTSLMSIEPTVSVTFDFGGTSIAVDPARITMTDRNGGTQYLVQFANELIDGIAIDEDRFWGKYDYDGKKWEFASAVMIKNGREVSEFYGDIFTYGKVLNEGDIFDVVFNFMEVQTSVTKLVSIDKDFGCYLSEDEFAGAYKSVHLYVDSTKYDLTAGTSTDINFEEDSTVKVVIGDDKVIWLGKCKLIGGEPDFTRNISNYYCNLGVDTSGVKVFNDFVYGSLGDGSGGADGGAGGHGATYYKHTYYDLTAKTVENDPISGISITDTDVSGFDGWSHGEAGLLTPLTSGELINGVHKVEDGLYFSYRVDEYGDPIGTLISTTNGNGFTNMSVPASEGNSYLGGVDRARPSVKSGVIRAEDDKVYVGDGNVELSDKVLTVDDIGYSEIKDEFAPEDSNAMLGSYYYLGYSTIIEPTKPLLIKDSFGNEIGTVTLEIVSTEANVPLNITSNGTAYDCLWVDGINMSFTPKITINMANGVKDWTVSADYEAATATFHIVATKAGKADVSVYDIYGASYENGVLDTSEAVTIPRYEKTYAEPNKTVSVDSKGVTQYDSKEYKPLASKDAESNISTANKLSIDVETGKSYEAFFYYGEGAEVPTPPEPPTEPEKPPVVPPTEPSKPPVMPPVIPPTEPIPPPKPDPDRPEAEKELLLNKLDISTHLAK